MLTNKTNQSKNLNKGDHFSDLAKAAMYRQADLSFLQQQLNLGKLNELQTVHYLNTAQGFRTSMASSPSIIEGKSELEVYSTIANRENPKLEPFKKAFFSNLFPNSTVPNYQKVEHIKTHDDEEFVSEFGLKSAAGREYAEHRSVNSSTFHKLDINLWNKLVDHRIHFLNSHLEKTGRPPLSLEYKNSYREAHYNFLLNFRKTLTNSYTKQSFECQPASSEASSSNLANPKPQAKTKANDSGNQNLDRKGKNPKFGSISLSINEFGKAAQNSQQQNKNVESICVVVPPVRPEIFNNDRYFSSHQLVPSIILLAGAFFIAIFYKIKNSKKPG